MQSSGHSANMIVFGQSDRIIRAASDLSFNGVISFRQYSIRLSGIIRLRPGDFFATLRGMLRENR
jgi:hypothetical protein